MDASTGSNSRAYLLSRAGDQITAARYVDVIGVGGGQLRQLATDASALASSPDGRRLLFSRRDDLWVMDADGAGRRGFPLTIAG